MESTAPAVAAALAAIALVGGAAIYITSTDVPAPNLEPQASAPAPSGDGAGLHMFRSFAEYAAFLSEYDRQYVTAEDYTLEDAMVLQSSRPQYSADSHAQGASPSPIHSTTNVQVVGVDEPDFVKNDGRHIYALKQNRLAIVDTQDPDPASAVSTIELDIPRLAHKHGMLLGGDRLAVLYYAAERKLDGSVMDYATHAEILDISDRESPRRIRGHDIPGKLETGRMVGDYTYVISSKVPDYADPAVPVMRLDGQTAQETPVYRPEGDNPFPGPPPQLVTVMAIDMRGGEANSVAFLMDPRGTAYMSHGSLYLTAAPQGSGRWEAHLAVTQLLGSLICIHEPHINYVYTWRLPDIGDPLCPGERRMEELTRVREGDGSTAVELLEKVLEAYAVNEGPDADAVRALSKVASDLGSSAEATEIDRIGVSGTGFELAARGTVPGSMLNQFSMDERAGALRVATTVGAGLSTSNNVFLLDPLLRATGALTGIAPGESIYAARFVDDRLYLVTFREVDPFFAIDLSGENPAVLGELKMPGYSGYLHFYDESTVIGVGREEGLKIAMFDITDIAKPALADSVVLGSQDAWSPAEDDHKALLVSRAHGILSIPVLGDIGMPLPSGGPFERLEPVRTGTFAFMVYGIGKGGLGLEQAILHALYHATDTRFARSLYIGESLYTVSESILARSPIHGQGPVERVPLGLGPAPA